MSEPIVNLRSVNVVRGDQIVLRDINLRINAGEHVVILGPNGCGKSTLLKTLTCELYPLIRADTSVQLLGRSRWDVTQLRRKMGVVSAEMPGDATLAISGFDAILTGYFSSSKLWPNLHVTPAMRERAEEILIRIKSESLRDRCVGQMSAGQQRRIMIGRALAGTEEMQMLLLDEPSNALDLGAHHDLRVILSDLANTGTAVLMITHNISDVIPEIHRIVMMKQGSIVADDTKEQLLTSAVLSDLFERELSVVERNGIFFAW